MPRILETHSDETLFAAHGTGHACRLAPNHMT